MSMHTIYDQVIDRKYYVCMYVFVALAVKHLFIVTKMNQSRWMELTYLDIFCDARLTTQPLIFLYLKYLKNEGCFDG